jgi:hypothetical protein
MEVEGFAGVDLAGGPYQGVPDVFAGGGLKLLGQQHFDEAGGVR